MAESIYDVLAASYRVCPFCGSGDIQPQEVGSAIAFGCQRCGATAGQAETRAKALALWSRRGSRPDPEHAAARESAAAECLQQTREALRVPHGVEISSYAREVERQNDRLRSTVVQLVDWLLEPYPEHVRQLLSLSHPRKGNGLRRCFEPPSQPS
ncbi:MAG: hypothetical protein NXI31_10770 [bacterium]|nr:hypothetical protein [bacterium]